MRSKNVRITIEKERKTEQEADRKFLVLIWFLIRIFPCWDQPNAKAIFELEVIAPSFMTGNTHISNKKKKKSNPRMKSIIVIVLSNTLLESKAKYSDRSCDRWKFAPTPLMSTYLLAFAMGEFDFLERRVKTPLYSKSGEKVMEEGNKEKQKEKEFTLRVYTSTGNASQAEFCLKWIERAFVFLTNATKVNYPMEKLDAVSFPGKEIRKGLYF